jgi:ParB family transcriptional regulator, chromosome partitioning protein
MNAMAARIASVDTAAPISIEREIPVALVDIARDHRKHPQYAIQSMAEDIDVRGQLQAIEVITSGDRFQLTFGRLRLEAVRFLNVSTIRALIKTPEEFASEAEPRLRSISENLLRNPLTALYRSVAIADWCAIYRAAQPALKPGPKPALKAADELSLKFRLNSDEQLAEASAQFAASFSDAAQAFLGISRASVFRALRIASIPSLERERIELHALAKSEGELYVLGGIKQAERQTAVVDLILSGKFASVEDALAHLDGRPKQAIETWEKMAQSFSRLQEPQQDRFFDLNEAGIMRWQAKRGRK